MFITEEQAARRLNSPDNLANRFNIGRDKENREKNLNAAQCESRLPTSEAQEADSVQQKEESRSLQSLSTEVDGRAEHPGIIHEGIRRPGRRGPWLPTEERTEIAIDAKIGGRKQKDIAEEHGISQVAVAKIKAGNGLVDEQAVEAALEAARNKALDRLMATLGFLTDDKISALDAKSMSYVAANMSRVVEKTMPDASKQAQINLVIYSPEIRNEKSFDTVEI